MRSYHHISCLDTSGQLQDLIHTSQVNREIIQISSNLKLHKMLFLAHTVAASGNAIKAFSYSGNPLAINLTQWIFLLKESIEIIKATTKNKTTEKIIHNRQEINNKWREINNITLRNKIFY